MKAICPVCKNEVKVARSGLLSLHGYNFVPRQYDARPNLNSACKGSGQRPVEIVAAAPEKPLEVKFINGMQTRGFAVVRGRRIIRGPFNDLQTAEELLKKLS